MTDKETIEKAKEEVAKNNGYRSWFALETLNLTPSMHFTQKVVKLLDESTLLALQLQREEIKKELREKIETKK